MFLISSEAYLVFSSVTVFEINQFELIQLIIENHWNGFTVTFDLGPDLDRDSVNNRIMNFFLVDSRWPYKTSFVG